LKQKTLQAGSLITTALIATVTTLSASEPTGFSITNSTAGRDSQGPTGSTRTVHWQSAFWALAAIAANSCLQESGNICEIRAKFGLFVKSSPVFCAVDAVVVWGQIIYYLTRFSPRVALRIVARSREQHSTGAPEESTSLPRIVGRCLLLLLALLQALKLYALRGIPWTQAFGTMYLLSYATNALLNVFGKPQTSEHLAQPDMRRGDILPSKELVHFFAVVAACLQIAIWAIVLRAAVPDQWLTALKTRRCGWPVNLVTLILFMPHMVCVFILEIGSFAVDLSILFLPPGLVVTAVYVLVDACLPSLSDFVAGAFGCSVKALRYTTTILVVVIALFVEICFLGPFPVTTAFLFSKKSILVPLVRFSDHWDRYTPYGFVLLALIVAAMISHFLYRALFMGSMARKIGITRYDMSSNLGWACLFMFLTNLALALLYYGHVYTSEGTLKPPWTENLGRII
jgi:hypothetical protein